MDWALPSVGGEEEFAVWKVLKSGWLSMGEQTAKFERELGSFIGNRKVTVVNSGTSALLTALIANNIGPGDEVIVPGNTFIATINSILALGAKPVLVDCDQENWNTTVDLMEPKINKHTKAIMPVDVAGTPCDYNSFIELSKRYNIPLIIDSAESLGAEYHSRASGAAHFNATFIFSFHMAKQVTTIEGGAVATFDKQLNEKIKLIRNHGMTGSDYRFKTLGLNFRITDLQSAIGREQLKKLPRAMTVRRAAVKYYKKRLGDNYKYQYVPPKTSSANLLFVILSKNRGEDIKKLNSSKIPYRICWPYVLEQPYHKNILTGTLPNTKQLSKENIALPFGNSITNEEIEKVCGVLK